MDDHVRNDGVKILLSRMDSHPQEFIAGGRWAWVTDLVGQTVNRLDSKPRPLPFLSDYEVHMLHNKYIELQGDWFTRRVMDELFRTKESYDFNKKFFTVVSAASPD